MNMLPHKPLSNHDRPEGIRIGVQELTHFGMGEPEIDRIAELIKECIIDKKTGERRGESVQVELPEGALQL